MLLYYNLVCPQVNLVKCEIIYPFPNLNGANIEVWEVISSHI